MKQSLIIAVLLTALLVVAACGRSRSEPPETPTAIPVVEDAATENSVVEESNASENENQEAAEEETETTDMDEATEDSATQDDEGATDISSEETDTESADTDEIAENSASENEGESTDESSTGSDADASDNANVAEDEENIDTEEDAPVEESDSVSAEEEATESEDEAAEEPAPAASDEAEESSEAESSQDLGTMITVLMNDLFFGETNDNLTNPPVWKVSSGEKVTLNLQNLSLALQHNWALVKQGAEISVPYNAEADEASLFYDTGPMDAQTETELTFTAPDMGEYLVICTVPGHSVVMQGKLVVE